jgi:hypothetical protein
LLKPDSPCPLRLPVQFLLIQIILKVCRCKVIPRLSYSSTVRGGANLIALGFFWAFVCDEEQKCVWNRCNRHP